MNPTTMDIDIPPDAAIPVTDGGVGRRGSGCAMVFLHGDGVRIEGRRLAPGGLPWDSEVSAVAMALDRALALGLRRLRFLIDSHAVALFVQGARSEEPLEREVEIGERLEAAAAAGLSVSARIVQGHAETADLPSRLNDLAHIASDLGTRSPFGFDIPRAPGWIDDLAERDGRFKPTRTPPRWSAQLPRRRAAHFLGVDVETVDALVRAGHLRLGWEGVRRASAAEVYVAAQNLKLDAYFGFDQPEGVPGRLEDEILRGWDGRPSCFYHRKSGLRPPAIQEPEDARAPSGM